MSRSANRHSHGPRVVHILCDLHTINACERCRCHERIKMCFQKQMSSTSCLRALNAPVRQRRNCTQIIMLQCSRTTDMLAVCSGD